MDYITKYQYVKLIHFLRRHHVCFPELFYMRKFWGDDVCLFYLLSFAMWVKQTMGMQEFRVPQIRCSMHLVYFSAFRGQKIPKRAFNLLPFTFYLCVFPKFGVYGKVLQLK